MKFKARQALESDNPAISALVFVAFGEVEGQEISNLISDLLKDESAQPLISLVATAHDKVVGHILFTSAKIKHSHRMVPAAILAPLSIHPEYQNQGIGVQLIRKGIKQLKAIGVEMVFVLGHPGYYPKHGFLIAETRGFEAPYPISPENSEAWMVQELKPGIMEGLKGKVICAEALDDPKYWIE